MQIMGIVNVTPDSFSDGGQFADVHAATEHALRLIDQGADIIDVGGESTRPGAIPLPLGEEKRRVLPVIEGIRRRNSSITISVDTYKAAVAEEALDAGANIINDVGAGRLDSAMFDLVRTRNVPYILMHMQGQPQTMQSNPAYTNVVTDIKDFFQERLAALGTVQSPVYIDPGIGFGKSTEHNLDILQNIRTFSSVAPIVIGLSRKRFLADVAGVSDTMERDLATMIVHTLATTGAVQIIRVHNVKYANVMRRIVEVLRR